MLGPKSIPFAAKVSLVWNRITFSRLTIAYFAFTVLHFILQLSFQIEAFTTNAKAHYFLKDIVTQGSASDGGLPLLKGNTLHMCSWLPNNLSVDVDACSVVWNGGKGNNTVGVQVTTTSTPVSSSTIPSSVAYDTPSSTSTSILVGPSVTSPSATATDVGRTGSPGIDSVHTVTVFVSPRPTGVPVIIEDEDGDLRKRANPGISAFDDNGQIKVNITGFGFDHTPATLDRSCLKALNWPTSQLHNTQREDLAFIGFQVWVLGMSFVALLNESIPHVAASLLTHLMATGWAANQIFATQKFRSDFNRVITNGACNGVFLLPNYWEKRGTAEIVVAALNILALVVAAFLSWKLVKSFGWQTFKRVGASLTINRIYKLVLVLSIVIQLGLFFMLTTVAVWIDQLWNSPIGDKADFRTLYQVTAIITLVALVPWLMTGWFAVRRELRVPMLVFLILCVLYLAGWSLLFISTTFRWTFVTWPFFGINASASVFLAVVAFILGIVCRLNFGKGLPRYLNAHQNLPESDYDSSMEKYHDVEKVEFPIFAPAVFNSQSAPYSQAPYSVKGPRFYNPASASAYDATPINAPANAHVATRKGSVDTSNSSLSRSDSNGSQGSQSSFYSYGGSNGHSRQDSNKQRWILE